MDLVINLKIVAAPLFTQDGVVKYVVSVVMNDIDETTTYDFVDIPQMRQFLSDIEDNDSKMIKEFSRIQYAKDIQKLGE